MRSKKRKNRVIVYDFDDINDKYLHSHFRKRIKYYQAEGFNYFNYRLIENVDIDAGIVSNEIANAIKSE